MSEKLTDEQIAHRWQSFRQLAVELAIKTGATPDTVVSVAKDIAAYILTKDAAELPLEETEA